MGITPTTARSGTHCKAWSHRIGVAGLFCLILPFCGVAYNPFGLEQVSLLDLVRQFEYNLSHRQMNKQNNDIEQLLNESEKQIKRVEERPTDVGWYTVAELALLRTRAELIKNHENHPDSDFKKKWVNLVSRLNNIRYPTQ